MAAAAAVSVAVMVVAVVTEAAAVDTEIRTASELHSGFLIVLLSDIFPRLTSPVSSLFLKDIKCWVDPPKESGASPTYWAVDFLASPIMEGEISVGLVVPQTMDEKIN